MKPSTADNIFANTWLHRAECAGKPAFDMDARKAFCAWLASSKLKNELLEDRVNAKELSDALEGQKLAQLNSGKVVNALMKDPDLQALFDSMGTKPIRPEQLKMAYAEKVAQRELERKKRRQAS